MPRDSFILETNYIKFASFWAQIAKAQVILFESCPIFAKLSEFLSQLELSPTRRPLQLSGSKSIFCSRCEDLAEIIWLNRQQIRQLEMIQEGLNIPSQDMTLNILPELSDGLTLLLDSLVKRLVYRNLCFCDLLLVHRDLWFWGLLSVGILLIYRQLCFSDLLLVMIAILFTKVFKVLKLFPFYIAMKVISEIKYKQKYFSFYPKTTKII